jgi:hypothetical protein
VSARDTAALAAQVESLTAQVTRLAELARGGLSVVGHDTEGAR